MHFNYTKKIFDPVHGFIKLTELETQLVDSFAFQRLHSIRQLGLTYKVYPGATHSRFEHSLGVMHVASSIFNQVSSELLEFIDEKDIPYYRQITRLAALTHDMGHLPFSHVAEKQLLGKQGHEAWTLSVIKSRHFAPIIETLSYLYPSKDAEKDLIATAIGEAKLHEMADDSQSSSPCDPARLLSCIITGDFFGADRIDYLVRDARCTGVSYGLFDYLQLIESIRVVKESQGFTLAIDDGGIPSCQALLLARHFMYQRVYQHPTVKVLSYHMAHFMLELYEKHGVLNDLESYLSYSDEDVLVHLKKGNSVHALALKDRSQRYVAVEIPQDIEECKLDAFLMSSQNKNFFIEPKKGNKTPWNFPVVDRGGKTREGKDLFTALSSTSFPRYAFIAPKQIPDFFLTIDKNI